MGKIKDMPKLKSPFVRVLDGDKEYCVTPEIDVWDKRKLKSPFGNGHFNTNHKNWKGNNVGYKRLHAWVRRWKPKPKKCEKCENKPFEVANISGKYKRSINDYKWLCRSCHTKQHVNKEKSKKISDALKKVVKKRKRDNGGKFIK